MLTGKIRILHSVVSFCSGNDQLRAPGSPAASPRKQRRSLIHAGCADGTGTVKPSRLNHTAGSSHPARGYARCTTTTTPNNAASDRYSICHTNCSGFCNCHFAIAHAAPPDCYQCAYPLRPCGFVKDVTVADGTAYAPGRNSLRHGACAITVLAPGIQAMHWFMPAGIA